MVLSVAVSNVLEREVTIKADEPSREPKKKFREGWMHIEIILPKDIVGGKLAKVNFIEASGVYELELLRKVSMKNTRTLLGLVG